MLAYLKEKGYQVAPFKVGPDFIDPGHHRTVSGRNSYNLDSWMLSRSYNQELFHAHSNGADIAVVEGVMGLFDGYDAVSETGSTAEMAKWLDLGVLLVVDAGGMARSAAALVKGFETFDPDLNICGVIFSRVGSHHHYEYLKTAVERYCHTPCYGFLPHNNAIALEERHLGLVTAQEKPVDKAFRSELVSMVTQTIDMEMLLDSLADIRPLPIGPGKDSVLPLDPPRIAVAKDTAFCFYYQDNLALLERFGAKIIEFSPLTDKALPEDVHGLYLGGGYPELHARRLSEQQELLRQIKQKSENGMPIYGECGGFMYLCDTLWDMKTQEKYKMAGVFPFSVTVGKDLRSLGYREITIRQDSVIGAKGTVLKGHEFHYSFLDTGVSENTELTPVIQDIFQVNSRAGQEISMKGYQIKNTLGSYFHGHFGSNPSCARHFVKKCVAYRKENRR